jgi:hypothetical protein
MRRKAAELILRFAGEQPSPKDLVAGYTPSPSGPIITHKPG